MDIPAYYEFCCKVNIVAGPSALSQIPALLAAKGVFRPMILTDKGVVAAGLVDIVTDAIGDDLTIPAVEDDIPPDSDVRVVNRLAGVYREKGCNAIIAVGGGSVLDTAKGVNILVSENADDLMAFTGAGALKRPLRPLIAVPTTAGTGSEVTLVAVIADHESSRKMLFTSDFLLPDAAVIDPRMTATLPPHITSATAMDAMSHAVEAYTMLAKNPLSDAHAVEAIALIRDNLLPVIVDPSDTNGRLALACAATMAGIAFSNAMVALVHALGHSVGSVCHVPHGTCMAILLPYGLEYNLHKVEDRIAELLLHLAGPETFSRTPEKDRALAAINWIRAFNRELNQATGGRHPIRLKDITGADGSPQVARSDLPRIAKTALGDGAVFYNPEDLDYEDLLMVAEAAWEGVPLDRTKIKS